MKLRYVVGNQHIEGCGIMENGSGYFISRMDSVEEENDFNRRLCAAWNYCEGVPTDELESKGETAGFWGRACSRLKTKNDKLQEQNAALRAAVLEMKRYLPVLEDLENDGIWDFATAGHGVATLNAYRQTLETALAKMNEK